MADVTFSQNDIAFLRKRDYKLLKELGSGACGRTVLLYDDMIDENFVCKKYHPFDETYRQELFSGFIREIKILHQLHHINVVRVFNYYLYPDQFTGYILMEYVNGKDIQEYLEGNPEKINEIFLQTISGFKYLEEAGVLHRDIRPQNIMVTSEGVLKIIDLGFGKQVKNSTDFKKSISLNLWCEPPNDFESGRYDFTTEVYFVAKFFEKIIQDNCIEHFNHTTLLRKMCERNPDFRISKFSLIAQSIQSDKFSEISFENKNLEAYREFANTICRHISKLQNGSKYIDDISVIIRKLSDTYRTFMLEKIVPDSVLVIRCFVEGTYYYNKNGFSVETVKNFLSLLKSCTKEEGKIILANLHTKLDTLQRYSEPNTDEDKIPF